MARILIVDDDYQTAAQIGNYLRGSGHECNLALSAEKALQLVRSDPVDLMVLDVMMPGGVSGFELCRRVRADTDLYMLPILIISAMSGEEEVLHGLAQGADDYITKPFDIQTLVQHAEALLRSVAGTGSTDEVTGLPSATAIKREVQRRISRQEIFDLVSVEALRLRELAARCGAKAREKAIRHVGRTMLVCGREGAQREDASSEGQYMVGHMGGGYFVSVVSPEKVAKYCNRVMKVWESHMPLFYESIGYSSVYADTLANRTVQKVPILDLLVCATKRIRREQVSSRELFDTLMKIRSHAMANQQTGIQMDRRG